MIYTYIKLNKLATDKMHFANCITYGESGRKQDFVGGPQKQIAHINNN